MNGPEVTGSSEAAIAMNYLAAIVESSDDAIISKDLKGIITSWNKGAEKIFGYEAGEMVGASILRIIPSDRQAEEDFILGKIRRGEKVEHFETLRQTKDGRRINISVTASPIKDGAGTIIGVSKIARDITVQNTHVAEILRLSRLYAALSQVNQAIVWTRNRDELLKKVCQVLVEFGKFSMAWIGQPETETRRVQVIARFGDKTDALSQVTIYADDRPEGQGPTGTAIHREMREVRNDFINETDHPQWREWASRANFRAAAAFPIRQSGKVWGALTVYADEAGFFRDKEIALLEETAGDVSFALDHLVREQALRENEERYKALFDRSLDCVFLNDFAGNLLDANPAALDLLGYQREDIATLTYAALLTEDQLPLALQVTEEIKTTGHQKHPVEFRLRSKAGRPVDVEIQSSLIYREGKPFAIQGIARDLTERKRALEKLQEKEAGLAESQRIAKLGSWQYDIASNHVRWSDELYRIFELEETQFNGTHEAFLKCVLPDDQPKVRQANAEAAASGTSFQIEYRIQTRAGELKHIREIAYARRDADGKVVGLFGTAQDVTEQKRGEESLRLLNSAVLQAKESVLITDAQLDWPGPKIVFANPAFSLMTGYSVEEVVGKTPRILQGPRTERNVLERLRRNLERGEVFNGEAIQYRKDGTEYHQEWQVAPLRDAAGKITHYLAIQHDVSGQRKLEEQFRQSQKMEAFGQLAGGVAHDFNNILAVIQLQAGVLSSERNLSLQQLELAGDIEKAADRGAKLTRQLLLFSRKQTMQPRNLKLEEAVENITKMLQRTLGEHFELQFKYAEAPLIIYADQGMIDQILLNLVVNARDAMPGGGKIVIATSTAEFDDLTATQLSQARPGLFACLSISDTGCGILPENRSRIFEPFFTTKQVGKGTGLGLATVFGIVQQHQGWINVYSEVGRGTTFRVYLPLLTKATDTEFILPSQTSMRGGNETILLVEDEFPVRNVVRIALSRVGYHVLEAANGEDAVAVWKQHREVASN